MLAALAWRNLWRQPVRTTLSLIGLAFSSLLLVFMLSFQFGVYDTMKVGALGLLDGFGQFQPEGYDDDPDISRLLSNWKMLMGAAHMDGVDFATPRASSFAIMASGDISFGAAVMGVDPVTEPQVSTLASTIIEGRYLAEGDEATIVMGEGLARNLGLSLGDSVTMLGTGNGGAVAADVLELVGIFSTGIAGLDRQITQMPLARFQEVYNLGDNVNVVALRSLDFNDMVNAAPDLAQFAASEGAVYLRWDELQPEVKQMITLDLSTAMLMYGVMIIVVVFILLNTLYMSVLERTHEFGLLRALGLKPTHVLALVALESALLIGLGVLIGMAMGAGTVWGLSDGIDLSAFGKALEAFKSGDVLYLHINPIDYVIFPLSIWALGVLVALWPAWRAAKIAPVEAMRHAT